MNRSFLRSLEHCRGLKFLVKQTHFQTFRSISSLFLPNSNVSNPVPVFVSTRLFGKRLHIFDEKLHTGAVCYTETAGEKNELGSVAGGLQNSSAKLYLQFTCEVCKTKVAKMISRVAYDHGIVIVKCPGCKNNHLIADNLSWTADGKRNIEEMMASKGERVRRTMTDEDCIEIMENDAT